MHTGLHHAYTVSQETTQVLSKNWSHSIYVVRQIKN